MLGLTLIATVTLGGGGRAWAQGPYLYATDDAERIPTYPPVETFIPDSNHVFSIADTTIELHGARGEWLGWQLAVIPQAGNPLTNLDVTAGDLAFGSHAIPAENISVFRTGFMTIDYQARCGLVPVRGALGDGTYRDFLIPMRDPYGGGGAVGAGLGADSTVVFWTDVHVPRAIPAGAYRGDVLITADELASPVVVHLVVDVWDFTIGFDTGLITLVGIHPDKIAAEEEVSLLDNGLNAEFFGVFQHYETMAREHGFDLMHRHMVPNYPFDASGNLITPVNWSNYDALVGPYIRGEGYPDGLPPKAWLLPYRPAFLAYPFAGPGDPDSLIEVNKVRTLTAEIQNHFESTYPGFPLDRAFLWVYDEPDFMGSVSGSLSVGEVAEIHRYYQTVKSASDLNVFLSEAVEDSLLLGAADWLASKADKYYPLEMQGAPGQGGVADVTLFYQANTEPDLGVETIDASEPAFLTWGWAAWMHRVPGMMYWAGNFWATNPYVVPDGLGEGEAGCERNNGQGTLFYPGRSLDDIGLPEVNGPLSSVRMKRLRRGIEDYAYFERLSDHGMAALADSLVDAVLVSSLCDSANYSPTKSFIYAGRPSHYRGSFDDPRGEVGLWPKAPKPWHDARMMMGNTLSELGDDSLMVWLLDPMGGETFEGGSTDTIRWQTSGAGPGAQIDLFLSTDGGASYADTIAMGEADDGEIDWHPSVAVGETLWVVVVVRDGGEEARDVIDAPVTVAESSFTLHIGFAQNPVLTQYLDVFVIPTTEIQDTSLTVTAGEDEIVMERGAAEQLVYHGSYVLPTSGLVRFVACARDLFGERRCFEQTASVSLVRPDVGGLVASADGGLLLRFPPGAFSRDTWVLVTGGASGGGGGGSDAGPAPVVLVTYRVGPVGRPLREPVEIRFPPQGAGWDGAGRERIGIEMEEGDSWKPLRSFIDPGTGDVLALAETLGRFRLVRSAGNVLAETLPTTLVLEGNHPNPFNPRTTIRYRLPARARVRLDIYDVSGRHVRSLVDRVQGPGAQEVTWEGADDLGRPSGSGVYLYRIEADGASRSQKMVMLK